MCHVGVQSVSILGRQILSGQLPVYVSESTRVTRKLIYKGAFTLDMPKILELAIEKALAMDCTFRGIQPQGSCGRFTLSVAWLSYADLIVLME